MSVVVLVALWFRPSGLSIKAATMIAVCGIYVFIFLFILVARYNPFRKRSFEIE